MSGLTGGNFLSTFTERLKYAAAEGLADSLTSMVFGKRDGKTGGGLFASLFSGGKSSLVADQTGKLPTWITSLVGRNAGGTDDWRGGLTWVGERGPELVDLKAGAQVFDHQQSIARAHAEERAAQAVMAANQASRARGAGGVVVNATFAPVLTITGGDAEEVARLRTDLAKMKASFDSDVVNAVNEGIDRRLVRSSD